MQQLDSDDFFWEMAAGEESELAPPSAAELQAYVEGGLDPQSQATLEAQLAKSPEGRQQLIELAGIHLGEPSAVVRERVLARLPKPVRTQADSSARKRAHRRLWISAAAAAIALVAVGLQWLVPGHNSTDIASFVVTQSGLKVDRSSDIRPQTGKATPFRAYLDTEITITTKIQGEPTHKIEYGLYLRRANQLERVEIPATVTHTCTDFVATARQVVGEEAGVYSLFVVAGLPGGLPNQVELKGRDPIRALEEESRGRAQPVAPLHLLAQPLS